MSSPRYGDGRTDTSGDGEGWSTDVDELVVESRSPRTLPALLAVALVVVAGWWLLRDEPAPAPQRPPTAATTSAPSSSARPPDPGARTIDQLSFLDADNGVALRLDCSTVNSEGYCARSLLATEDGGRTWTARSDLPAFSEGYARLLVDPTGPIAVLDVTTMGALGRSLDGGRTWAQVPLVSGTPEPAPVGSTLLTDLGVSCGSGCGDLLYIDVASATLHRVPAQPEGGQGDWLSDVGRSDGLLSVTDTVGAVAISPDGGVSWRVTSLPVEVPPDQTLGGSVIRPAGGDRIYAFVQIVGSVGLETTYGFRTDDAGVTWTDIDFEGRSVWVPAGVVQGELVTTNLPGGVFLSSGDGTVFSTVPATPRSMFLSQGDPGGVVLGTVFDQQGRSTYFLSRDGRAWAPLRLPTG